MGFYSTYDTKSQQQRTQRPNLGIDKIKFSDDSRHTQSQNTIRLEAKNCIKKIKENKSNRHPGSGTTSLNPSRPPYQCSHLRKLKLMIFENITPQCSNNSLLLEEHSHLFSHFFTVTLALYSTPLPFG